MIRERKPKNAVLNLGLILLSVGLLLSAMSQRAVAHVLDHMDTGSESITLSGGTLFGQNDTIASGAAGGFRHISLAVDTNGGGENTAKVVLTAPHRFFQQLGDLSTGNSTIVWTGALNGTGCSLNLDLFHQPNAATQFFIEPVAIDHNATICLDVFYPSGSCGSSATVCKKKLAFDVSTWIYPFTDFGIGYSTFASIGRLAVRVMGIPVQSTSLDISLHALGDNCTFAKPTVASFSATPNQQTSPQATTLCWTNLNVNGNPSPVTVRVKGISGGGLGYSWSGNSGGGNGCATGGTTPSSIPAAYRLTVVGICDNTTLDASITSEPSRVPSLNEWGMIILSLVLAGSAIWLLRRKRTN